MAATGVPGDFIFSPRITEEEPGGDFIWLPGLSNVSSARPANNRVWLPASWESPSGRPLGWEQDEQSGTGLGASV